MRVFRLLALRRLRYQPLRAAIAVVAVAAGVSLAVAILVVTSSLARSVEDFGRTLAGPTELRVLGATRNGGGLSPEVVDRVAGQPGVNAVVPVIQAVTIADRADGAGDPLDVIAFGVDCRVSALFVEEFRGVECDDEVLASLGNAPIIMGAGLAAELGPGGTLRTDAGRVSLDQVVSSDRLDVLNGGRIVIFTMAAAQQLFAQPGEVDIAYVDPADGVDVVSLQAQLETVVGENNAVLTASDPPPQIAFVLAAFLPLFTLLGLFALGTGAVLVHNTVTLSLEERRRQLAVLGSLGATARVVVGGTVAEAGLLGLAGGVVGSVAGSFIARPITSSLSQFTESIVGIPLEVHVTPRTLVAGIVLGALVGAGAALLPGRRAMRIDVASELSGRGQTLESKPVRLVRRLAIWTALGTLGLALCWIAQRGGALEPWQAAVAPLGFLLAALGYLLAGSAFAPLLLSRWPRRQSRASVRLAMANLVRDPRRTGVMATAVSSAVITAFMTSSFVTSAEASIRQSLLENLDGVAVSTVGPNEQLAAFLSPAHIAAIEALPEVDSVLRGSIVVAGTDGESLIAVEAFDDPFLDARVFDGVADRTRLDAGEVLIGPGLARREGLRAGDSVRLPTKDGFVELPIQGVWEMGDFGGMNVFTSLATLESVYGPQPPLQLTVRPVEGVSFEQLAAVIEAANLDPEIKVFTPDELTDEIVVSIRTQMAPFEVLQRGLLVVAFVAVLSTLLLVGIQRRREMGLLAAVGMRPGELARMVVVEAGIVGIVALVQSAIFGALMLRGLLDVIPVLIGFRDPYSPDIPGFFVAGSIAIAIALLAALWPARRAARVEVLDALRYE